MPLASAASKNTKSQNTRQSKQSVNSRLGFEKLRNKTLGDSARINFSLPPKKNSTTQKTVTSPPRSQNQQPSSFLSSAHDTCTSTTHNPSNTSSRPQSSRNNKLPGRHLMVRSSFLSTSSVTCIDTKNQFLEEKREESITQNLTTKSSGHLAIVETKNEEAGAPAHDTIANLTRRLSDSDLLHGLSRYQVKDNVFSPIKKEEKEEPPKELTQKQKDYQLAKQGKLHRPNNETSFHTPLKHYLTTACGQPRAPPASEIKPDFQIKLNSRKPILGQYTAMGSEESNRKFLDRLQEKMKAQLSSSQSVLFSPKNNPDDQFHKPPPVEQTTTVQSLQYIPNVSLSLAANIVKEQLSLRKHYVGQFSTNYDTSYMETTGNRNFEEYIYDPEWQYNNSSALLSHNEETKSYSIDFSSRVPSIEVSARFALSSFHVGNSRGNCVQIVDLKLDEDFDNFVIDGNSNAIFSRVAEVQTGFPATKVLWGTDTVSNLLGVSTSNVTIYKVDGDNQLSKHISLSPNKKKSTIKPADPINQCLSYTYRGEICPGVSKYSILSSNANSANSANLIDPNDLIKVVGHRYELEAHSPPITSFDWAMTNPNRIAMCSVDTTISLWDVEYGRVETQMIAHDKAVYDVKFVRDSDTVFASVSADGSMRLFDYRDLDHSTIMFEAPSANFHLTRICRMSSNHITVLSSDGSIITFDTRKYFGRFPYFYDYGEMGLATTITESPTIPYGSIVGTTKGKVMLYDLKNSIDKASAITGQQADRIGQKNPVSPNQYSVNPLSYMSTVNFPIADMSWPSAQPGLIGMTQGAICRIVAL